MVAYADADHGGDTTDCKSTSAYLIYVGGTLVQWKSKKQGLVAQSTMEAELIATAEAWKQVQWMEDALRELKHETERPTLRIENDNMSTVLVLGSGNFSSSSRHLRLRFHGLVEAIASGQLEIGHIGTANMRADGLTKPLERVKLEEMKKVMGLVKRGSVVRNVGGPPDT